MKQEQDKSEKSYFDTLTFLGDQFFGITKAYFTNIRIAILAVLLLVGAGTASYLGLPRTLNPEVKIPIVIVTTVLPGASPNEVESLVTDPLEDEIKGLSGLDMFTSTSRENVSVIVAQFFSDIDPTDAKNDIQSAAAAADLPTDAVAPRVETLDFENMPIWNFVVSGGDAVSLERFSRQLKDDLEDLSEIEDVAVTGLATREVRVTVTPEAAARYGVSAAALARSVSASVRSHPAGSVDAGDASFAVAIDSAANSVRSLGETPISLNGTVVSLSDIATITDEAEPRSVMPFFFSPDESARDAVSFDVFRASNTNIDDAAKAARAVVDAAARYDGQFRVHTITDFTRDIDREFSSLTQSFFITIALVFGTLILFFGIRQAAISALAIPLAFFATFIVMSISGITLNFLSLFSLLLTLGLLVDVTIVVVSAISSYVRSEKFSPREAGLLVFRDFRITLLTTTLTTVWAFLPLLLASGIIGEFIKPIPIVVSTTLFASLLIGLFLTLPFMIFVFRPRIPRRVRILLVVVLFGAILSASAVFLRRYALFAHITTLFAIFLVVVFVARGKIAASFRRFSLRFHTAHNRIAHAAKSGVVDMHILSRRYRALLEKILRSSGARRKTIFAVVIFFIFSFSLAGFGLVRNEFFPKVDEPMLFVQGELPTGTSLERTRSEALSLSDQLRDIPEATGIKGETGKAIAEDGSPVASAENSLLYTVALRAEEDRSRSSSEIAEDLRDALSGYDKGKISVVEVSGGPPAGADVQITFLGDDFSVLNTLADQAIRFLKETPGTVNVDTSFRNGTPKIAFVPNRASVAEAGITNDDIAITLRGAGSGVTLAEKVTIDGDDRDIVLYTSSDRADASLLSRLTVSTKRGEVPLAALGEFELRQNPTQITHRDSKRTITVSSGVKEGFSVSDTGAALETFAAAELSLPSGYSWKTGGVNEENQKSVNSILQAMLLSAALILATMVVQLGSFRKAFLVMLVIPLAISGVFVVFALTGTPLSFPALIGVLALFGIVVNNSIILIDKINLNLRAGLAPFAALTDAAASRMEPIALSSLTTIIGLVPITLSNPLWQGLGGAIIAGLLFSGTIMLFFIPVVYAAWFGIESE